jgi:hypothetical protein
VLSATNLLKTSEFIDYSLLIFKLIPIPRQVPSIKESKNVKTRESRFLDGDYEDLEFESNRIKSVLASTKFVKLLVKNKIIPMGYAPLTAFDSRSRLKLETSVLDN